MKTKYLILPFICLAVLSFSCKEEDFNPKGEFKQKYVLNCVLRTDTTVQVVTLTSSYNVAGFNPGDNKTDPALENADVRMWYDESVIILKPGTDPRGDTSRYNTPYKYYYAENFQPAPGKTVEIEAVLQNGRRLHATTVIPRKIDYDFERVDSVVPPAGKNYVTTAWQPAKDPNTFFYPKFKLVYFKVENSVPVRYLRTIPVKYVKSGGTYAPIYARPTTQPTYTIETDAVNRVMEEISAGDPNKKNYIVLAFIYEIMTLDINLSSYYSSSSQFDEGFSVKVDQADYSNVEGGLGIFGAYSSVEYAIRLDKNYIRSFGYKTKLGPE
ncbi:MAG: DUF4249 family protein [Ignavibacteriales bacterium]